MFVVEVGAVLTTIQTGMGTLPSTTLDSFGFGLQITLWLWFTVLFLPTFAEAMAEGRGKAQADTPCANPEAENGKGPSLAQ